MILRRIRTGTIAGNVVNLTMTPSTDSWIDDHHLLKKKDRQVFQVPYVMAASLRLALGFILNEFKMKLCLHNIIHVFKNTINGLEDTGRRKDKLGRNERVALTYIHYQMQNR